MYQINKDETCILADFLLLPSELILLVKNAVHHLDWILLGLSRLVRSGKGPARQKKQSSTSAMADELLL